MTQVERQTIIARLAIWHDDPVQFVRDNFEVEPDAWQAKALQAAATDPRVGMSACKGPGKTAVLGWIIWWFVSTRPHANVIALSITEDNLRDGLWKELAVWLSRPKAAWLRAAFEMKGERISARESPKTWWVSARAFAQSANPLAQANTIAGLHSPRVMVVFDEMGDYPEGVVQAGEGIFANKELAEAKLIAAWNPTSVDGPAYRICARDRGRWTLIHITGDPEDPNRSPRISLDWARQMIEDWGYDSDVVRINVRGVFPKTSSDKLLGPDDVQAAISRGARREEFDDQAKVMGLDVAAFGDDSSVLIMRQGVMCWEPSVWRELGPTALLDRVISVAAKHKPDAIFVDTSGGYGLAVYEGLKRAGFIAEAVDFAGIPSEPRFLNKRAEIHWRAAEWVKAHGCLPSDSDLAAELTWPSITYGTSGKKSVLKLEPKVDIKKRTGRSPDKSDALALTFARHVEPRSRNPLHLNLAPSTGHDFQPAIG